MAGFQECFSCCFTAAVVNLVWTVGIYYLTVMSVRSPQWNAWELPRGPHLWASHGGACPLLSQSLFPAAQSSSLLYLKTPFWLLGDNGFLSIWRCLILSHLQGHCHTWCCRTVIWAFWVILFCIVYRNADYLDGKNVFCFGFLRKNFFV